MPKATDPLKTIPPAEIVRRALEIKEREVESLRYLLGVSTEVERRLSSNPPARQTAGSE